MLHLASQPGGVIGIGQPGEAHARESLAEGGKLLRNEGPIAGLVRHGSRTGKEFKVRKLTAS